MGQVNPPLAVTQNGRPSPASWGADGSLPRPIRGKHMAVAPFEPAEVKIVDRQDDAVVVVFQSAEGGEFPMKFQRAQLAGLVSQFEKEVGRNQPGPPPEQKIVAPDQNVRIVGWQVQKRRDGARRLTFKVEMPT